MRDALAAMRKLLFGETWTIPLGVAASLLVALLSRHALPAHVWSAAGGFLICSLVAATLVLSLRDF